MDMREGAPCEHRGAVCAILGNASAPTSRPGRESPHPDLRNKQVQLRCDINGSCVRRPKPYLIDHPRVLIQQSLRYLRDGVRGRYQHRRIAAPGPGNLVEQQRDRPAGILGPLELLRELLGKRPAKAGLDLRPQKRAARRIRERCEQHDSRVSWEDLNRDECVAPSLHLTSAGSQRARLDHVFVVTLDVPSAAPVLSLREVAHMQSALVLLCNDLQA